MTQRPGPTIAVYWTAMDQSNNYLQTMSKEPTWPKTIRYVSGWDAFSSAFGAAAMPPRMVPLITIWFRPCCLLTTTCSV